jgi:hypothetical protein
VQGGWFAFIRVSNTIARPTRVESLPKKDMGGGGGGGGNMVKLISVQDKNKSLKNI